LGVSLSDAKVPQTFQKIAGPCTATEISEADLQPGDIVLLGWQDQRYLEGFRAYHTTVFLSKDDSGTLHSGDQCIMANSSHNPNKLHRVAICNYNFLNQNNYRKAVVIRVAK